MQQDIKEGFAALQSSLDQTRRDLGDKIDKLDRDFIDVDERTEALERHSFNGSSAPADSPQ